MVKKKKKKGKGRTYVVSVRGAYKTYGFKAEENEGAVGSSISYTGTSKTKAVEIYNSIPLSVWDGGCLAFSVTLYRGKKVKEIDYEYISYEEKILFKTSLVEVRCRE